MKNFAKALVAITALVAIASCGGDPANDFLTKLSGAINCAEGSLKTGETCPTKGIEVKLTGKYVDLAADKLPEKTVNYSSTSDDKGTWMFQGSAEKRLPEGIATLACVLPASASAWQVASGCDSINLLTMEDVTDHQIVLEKKPVGGDITVNPPKVKLADHADALGKCILALDGKVTALASETDSLNKDPDYDILKVNAVKGDVEAQANTCDGLLAVLNQAIANADSNDSALPGAKDVVNKAEKSLMDARQAIAHADAAILKALKGSTQVVTGEKCDLSVDLLCNGQSCNSAEVRITNGPGYDKTSTVTSFPHVVKDLDCRLSSVTVTKTGYQAKTTVIDLMSNRSNKVQFDMKSTPTTPGGQPNTLAPKASFVLPAGQSLDMCGALYRFDSTGVQQTVDCSKLTLTLKTGSSVTVSGTKVTATTTTTGTSVVEWCFTGASPAQCDEFSVHVP